MTDPRTASQSDDRYRFEWGPNGLRALAPEATVVVVVDVIGLSTVACAVIEAGGTVVPWRREDLDPEAHARSIGAVVLHGEPPPVADALALPDHTTVVVPSARGAALVDAASDHGAGHVLVGCLRNASATARLARRLAGEHGGIAVIAAGARWRGATGPLRPAVEDLIAAGAVLAALDPSAAVGAPRCSPEAAAARDAFLGARADLVGAHLRSTTGRARDTSGDDADVVVTAALDVTDLAVRALTGPGGTRLVGVRSGR